MKAIYTNLQNSIPLVIIPDKQHNAAEGDSLVPHIEQFHLQLNQKLSELIESQQQEQQQDDNTENLSD